jgi:hypothetical protein
MSRFLRGHNMQTHNNSLANLRRGVGERVLYTDKNLTLPTQPVNNVFTARCGVDLATIARGIGRQSPVSHNQFVEYYKGPRKLFYQRAVDRLAIKAVCPRDAHLKTFIKAEKLNFTIKNDPAPRVIQPRSGEFNVEVGCYLRPIEHKVYDEIDKLFSSPTIFSKYNSKRQAELIRDKWDSFAKPACVGIDASRFDQHCSVQALEFEHDLYNSIYGSRKLKRLLKYQLNNHGIARGNDGWFRYFKRGSRMSGDMNTSMGNKLLMCLMAHAYIKTKTFKIEFVNNGDDCLLILERKNLRHLADLEVYFKAFGFKMVRETPVYEFEQIEFCQTKPVMTSNGWIMVRNVMTCLSKDVTCVNLGHDVELYRVWLKKIASCGVTLNKGVPILQEFYKMLDRFGVEGNLHSGAKFECEYNWHNKMVKGLKTFNYEVTEQARYSFWLQTDISPDQQCAVEEYFAQSVWGGDKRQLINNLGLF